MGQSGHKLIQERFAWSQVVTPMVEVYRAISYPEKP
jgi:hypothetical protein